MTENAADGKGLNMTKAQVYQYYAVARDRISRYAIYSIHCMKMGGPKKAVAIDFCKTNLRNRKGEATEYLVVGFIDR